MRFTSLKNLINKHIKIVRYEKNLVNPYTDEKIEEEIYKFKTAALSDTISDLNVKIQSLFKQMIKLIKDGHTFIRQRKTKRKNFEKTQIWIKMHCVKNNKLHF